MKISFYCPECHTEFDVESRYFPQKQSVKCPNCDSEFPYETFKKLRDHVYSIEQIRQETSPWGFQIIDK